MNQKVIFLQEFHPQNPPRWTLGGVTLHRKTQIFRKSLPPPVYFALHRVGFHRGGKPLAKYKIIL